MRAALRLHGLATHFAHPWNINHASLLLLLVRRKDSARVIWVADLVLVLVLTPTGSDALAALATWRRLALLHARVCPKALALQTARLLLH